MVKIEILMKAGKVSRISEVEQGRYINFFENSYRDNLEHCRFSIEKFPRWSIISGYYAMHDITKLLLAKKFGLKVEADVHSTTIKALAELVNNREIVEMMERGYKEFISLANDLAEAKKERVKVQYFTGTDFMKSEYAKKAKEFYESQVLPYLEKIKEVLGE